MLLQAVLIFFPISIFFKITSRRLIKGPLPVRLVRISLPTVMRSEQNTRRHTPNCINTEYHSQKPTRFKTEFFCLSLNRLMIMFAKMATACGMDSAELAL